MSQPPNFLDNLEAQLQTASSGIERRTVRRRRIGMATVLAAVVFLGVPRLFNDDSSVAVTTIEPTTTTVNSTTSEPTTPLTTPSPQPVDDENPGDRDPDGPNWMPIGPLETRGQTVQVWTGAELIVYGGNTGDDTPFLRTGAAYSPQSQTWRSIAEAPEQSGSITGVWTGSDLLVVSGTTTSLYDPAADSWTQTEGGVGAGQIVHLDTAYVMNDSGVFGLRDNDWQVLPKPPENIKTKRDMFQSRLFIHNDRLTISSTSASYCGGRHFAQFDGTQWTELPSLELAPVAGDYADCSWANQVGVAGGRIIAWESRNFETMALDEEANRWEQIDTIPASATEGGPSGVSIGDDLMVSQFPASVLDGENLTWRPASLPSPALDSYMVWTGTEILMWGSPCCYGTSRPLSTHEAWRWAPPSITELRSDNWQIDPINDFAPRESATYATGGEWLFIWGGFPDRSPERPTAALTINTRTDERSITPFSPPLEPRQAATAVWTGEDFIVFGGHNDTQSFGNGGIYDPFEGKWRPMADSTFEAGSTPTAVWANDRMYTWMPEPTGLPVPRKGPGQFGAYSPDTDTWTILDPPPVSIVGAQLVKQEGQILLVGGPPMRDIGTAGHDAPVQLAAFNLATKTWEFIDTIETTGEATRLIELDDDLYIINDSGTATPLNGENQSVTVPTNGCWYDIAVASANNQTYLKSCGNIYRYTEGKFEPILLAGDPATTANTYGSGFIAAENGTLFVAGKDLTSSGHFFVSSFSIEE